MRIEISFTNKFNENFSIGRDVENDFEDMTEIEFLHDSYKAFLNTYGYPIDTEEFITVAGTDENGEYYTDN